MKTLTALKAACLAFAMFLPATLAIADIKDVDANHSFDLSKPPVALISIIRTEEEEHLSDVCVCCGKPAKHMVYWGKAY